MIPQPPKCAAEFVVELEQFSKDDLARPTNSPLFVAAQVMRTGAMPLPEYRIYKFRVLEYVVGSLVECSQRARRAFFEFILISQIVDEDEEVRESLFHLFRSRLNLPVDGLFVEITAAIIRTNRNPTAQLSRAARPKVLESFRKNPAWNLVPLMASLITRGDSTEYTFDAFLRDLARLDDGLQFESNVKSLNAVWQRIGPNTDSIEILLAVRRANSAYIEEHPTLENLENRFAAEVNKLCARIVLQ